MDVQKTSDQELIRLYLQGNEASLETLIKRHQRNVFTAIYIMVRNRSLAEDIFQET
jgi:RNA polymerase sigma-70 factor (ECF subfamily)